MAEQSIKDKILSDSPEIKVPQPQKKQNKKNSIWSLPFRALCALLGLDWEKIKTGKTTTNYIPTSTGYNPPPPPPPHGGGPEPRGNIRDIYSFDPVQADNIRIYVQGQDGKGDPSPHCDCDHDER